MDDERCAEAARIARIEAAFRAGDLDALRAAVDDPAVLPNGLMPPGIGNCLVNAIYHSPLAFIRTLLDLGADPNTPADDGFPPLIAALSCSRSVDGAPKRADVDDIIRLLLARGADPNQRGLNDWTPLHMAVAERNLLAVHRLLDAGADRQLRTRIDDCETPLEGAQAANLPEFVAALDAERTGAQRLRSGLVLLVDVPGEGDLLRRQHNYLIRLRLWLHRGDAVRWPTAWGPVGIARLEDEGDTLVTEVRVNRGQLMNGLFYGMDGMRVGGTRRLEIAPHLAYGERGVPGVIPENALLTAEITILSQT